MSRPCKCRQVAFLPGVTYFKPVARFFSEILRGLKPGGTFLMEAYTTDHYKRQSPPNPIIDFDQCYRPNEALTTLRNFEIIYYNELPDGNAHTVQVIARKNQK